jgi:hypothetical protein
MSEWRSWRDACQTLPLEERLRFWIDDLLLPILADGVVDELENRLLEVSWWVYGLEDAAAHLPALEAVLTAAEQRKPLPAPSSGSDPSMTAARLDSVRGLLTAEEQRALDRLPGRPEPLGRVVVGPSAEAFLARIQARPPASPRPAEGPRNIKLVAGAESLELRIRTDIAASLVTRFGEDARFYDASAQYTLSRSEGGWVIIPNAAAVNETLLNGKALVSETLLRDGDVIAVGREAKGVQKLPLTVHLM